MEYSDSISRSPTLGHRCLETVVTGRLRYNPHRKTSIKPWVACIELPDDFAKKSREIFSKRHNIVLEEPEHGFHLTVFRGPVDHCPALERIWGHLDGEKVQVHLTNELFWKERFVWANAYCYEYHLLRETLCGLDSSDSELWGHATVGTFPEGWELPRFLDYRDLPDWGFRP